MDFALGRKKKSTFWSAEHLASLSALQDCAEDSLTPAETSCLLFLHWLIDLSPDGWYGKTSPASCPAGEDGTLVPSSGRWDNSGMGTPTESWTLNTLEFPSEGVACSLSDVLETGDVPRRFFLSATACRGILRRAEKRGKELPEPLRHALEAVAGVIQPTTQQLDICRQ